MMRISLESNKNGKERLSHEFIFSISISIRSEWISFPLLFWPPRVVSVFENQIQIYFVWDVRIRYLISRQRGRRRHGFGGHLFLVYFPKIDCDAVLPKYEISSVSSCSSLSLSLSMLMVHFMHSQEERGYPSSFFHVCRMFRQ